MATPIYAAASDYQAWTGVATLPVNITQILRTASLAVREATEMFYYTVDANSLPVDADTKQAFNDATCCQAAALVALEYDPNTGGTATASVEQGTSIGTAHITYAAADTLAAVEAKRRAITGLVPEAQRILRNAGVYKTGPWIAG